MTRSLGSLTLAGCLLGCTPGSLAVGVPWLEASPSSQATVRFGISNVVGVEVTNRGTAEADITATGSAPLYVPADPVIAAPGATVAVPVVWAPDRYEPLNSTVFVSTDIQRVPIVLTLLVDADDDNDGHAAIGAGGDDCDDTDPNRHPGAVERCDGLDQDCDDQIDEDVPDPPAWYVDADGDGYGAGAPMAACEAPPGRVADGTDCDDTSAGISPGADEVWYDGIDEDCDGRDDFDQDGDDHDAAAYGGDDCDDEVATVHPGAIEIWYDGWDQDCDGNDDDQDRDGVPGGPSGTDCDDTDPDVYPGAIEVTDGLDNDCDGSVDEGP